MPCQKRFQAFLEEWRDDREPAKVPLTGQGAGQACGPAFCAGKRVDNFKNRHSPRSLVRTHLVNPELVHGTIQCLDYQTAVEGLE